MPPRFWMTPPLAAGDHILDGTEAHHLTSVLRLHPGDVIELFDGQGRAAEAVITACTKRTVTVQVAAVHNVPPLAPRITLAAAVPKGERFDWLVEKTAELGVGQLIPLLTTRGTVDPRPTKLDRLRQVVIAACKQSRNNWAMTISPPTSWPDVLAAHPSTEPLWIADPSGQPFREHSPLRATGVTIAIGPEGGWTPDELAAGLQCGGHVVSLGATILRIETAAIVAAVLSGHVSKT